MRVAVDYQGQTAEFEVGDEQLAGSWQGPPSVAPDEVAVLTREALDNPRAFPPLGQTVVSGDHVVIALDPDVPDAGALLGVVFDRLRAAGVMGGDIDVLLTGGTVPEGTATGLMQPRWMVHDPADRTALAYLASTREGRRVYLNRQLTDADVVLPIGLLGFDDRLGYRGPWSVVFPGLSDTETQTSFGRESRGTVAESGSFGTNERSAAALKESAEVSWLLGSMFQIGVLPGRSGGLAGVIAGEAAAVREQGSSALDRAWHFETEDRVDLVVVGIGGGPHAASIDDLARGLQTAASLVRHGGKIVALSRVSESPGPAVEALMGLDDPREAREALSGHQHDADYTTAAHLAEALTWADVYLLSDLDEQVVEGLSMIALARPEEARRLVALSPSCLFVSQADRVRAEVASAAR